MRFDKVFILAVQVPGWDSLGSRAKERLPYGLPIAQQEHPFEQANAALHQTSEASSEHDSP